jgi:hypothetical protein
MNGFPSSASVGSHFFGKKKSVYWKWRGPIYPCKSRANIEKKIEKRHGTFSTFCKLGQKVLAGKGGAMRCWGHDTLGTFSCYQCAPTHNSYLMTRASCLLIFCCSVAGVANRAVFPGFPRVSPNLYYIALYCF